MKKEYFHKVNADLEYETMRDREGDLLRDNFVELLNDFFLNSPYYKGRGGLLKQHLDSFFNYWYEEVKK
jgi:hypothetical protein